jgi:hypothetical protein
MKWTILLSRDDNLAIEYWPLNIEHYKTRPVNQAVTKFSLSKRVKSKKGTKLRSEAFEAILERLLKMRV